MTDCCHYDEGYDEGYDAALKDNKRAPHPEAIARALRWIARSYDASTRFADADVLERAASEIERDPGLERWLDRYDEYAKRRDEEIKTLLKVAA